MLLRHCSRQHAHSVLCLDGEARDSETRSPPARRRGSQEACEAAPWARLTRRSSRQVVAAYARALRGSSARKRTCRPHAPHAATGAAARPTLGEEPRMAPHASKALPWPLSGEGGAQAAQLNVACSTTTCALSGAHSSTLPAGPSQAMAPGYSSASRAGSPSPTLRPHALPTPAAAWAASAHPSVAPAAVAPTPNLAVAPVFSAEV
eukprot:scaffold23090_cov33-Tisochrysis_lutea.AAC.2